MFQDRYFVPKSTDTYADVLTAWGLATVLSGVLSQAGVKKSNQVVISDCGAAFCVELPVALEEAWVNAAQREQLTYFILDAAEKTLVKKFETAAKKSKALESANEKNKAAKNREYQSAKSEADLWEQFIINARNSASSRIVDLNLERERSNKRKEWTELNDSRTNDPLLQ